MSESGTSIIISNAFSVSIFFLFRLADPEYSFFKSSRVEKD